MQKSKRRQWSTEQKVVILRQHLADKTPVSTLCEKHSIQPSLFYLWQKQVFDNLAGAFSEPAASGPSKREKELVAKAVQLEQRLAKKDSVIAEISGEYVQLKKELGEL